MIHFISYIYTKKATRLSHIVNQQVMKSLRSQKIQATKEIKSCKEYYCDLITEVINQYPQPDGSKYLHGERITAGRIWRAEKDLQIAEFRRQKLN